MHFHWFWGNHRRLADHYELPKYLSVIGILITLAVHGYCMLYGNPLRL